MTDLPMVCTLQFIHYGRESIKFKQNIQILFWLYIRKFLRQGCSYLVISNSERPYWQELMFGWYKEFSTLNVINEASSPTYYRTAFNPSGFDYAEIPCVHVVKQFYKVSHVHV